MEHYVTLFDSLFLPQGLALHMSMERHVKEYTLWILCVDEEAYNVLTKLQLSNVMLLNLSKFETERLLRVKPARSKGEYCWTLTPFAPRFVFEADQTVERVTYLDADLWFRNSPSAIFSEFHDSGASVLVTDHAYAPEYDASATSGKYCVQFMIFDRIGGEEVRKWWEDACIDWCYARHEDGKFGDQKYLDCWPELFPKKVHVLINKELTMAPWNAIRFPYGNAVVWHFQGLRLISNNLLMIGDFKIPRVTFENVYTPYFNDLAKARLILTDLGLCVRSQMEIRLLDRLKMITRPVLRRIFKPPLIRRESYKW